MLLPLLLPLLQACSAVPEDSGPALDSGHDTGGGDTGVAADPWGELSVPDGGPVTASGWALAFSPLDWLISGAEIRIVELPDRVTTSAEDASWVFEDLPRGQVVTFELVHPDYPPIRTGSFLLGDPLDGGDRLQDVTFQAPDHDMYAIMSNAAGSSPDPEHCQVATTITRRGHSMLAGGPTHGEPEATATMVPDGTWEQGPVYFNLHSSGLIWPDPTLTETTHDGGVLWTNVKPGHYWMEGHKDGAVIRPVRIDCAAGYLVNASPPWGLQVLEGGLDPDDPDFGLD